MRDSIYKSFNGKEDIRQKPLILLHKEGQNNKIRNLSKFTSALKMLYVHSNTNQPSFKQRVSQQLLLTISYIRNLP